MLVHVTHPGVIFPVFLSVCMEFSLYVCMVLTHSKSMDRPGKVANPARGQLNRENEYFPVFVRA